jgi:hypothetical protein
VAAAPPALTHIKIRPATGLAPARRQTVVALLGRFLYRLNAQNL